MHQAHADAGFDEVGEPPGFTSTSMTVTEARSVVNVVSSQTFTDLDC